MDNLFIQMLFTNKFIKKKEKEINKRKEKKKERSTCGHGLLERRASGIETKKPQASSINIQAPKAILTYKWKFACCIPSLKVMCTLAN